VTFPNGFINYSSQILCGVLHSMGDTWAVLYHPPMFSNVALILSYELKHLQMLWQEWFWP